MAQQKQNPASIHEDVGSIPGLPEWVKDQVCLVKLGGTELGRSLNGKPEPRRGGRETPLWRSRLGGVVGALGRRFHPRPRTGGGLRIRRCHSCS